MKSDEKQERAMGGLKRAYIRGRSLLPGPGSALLVLAVAGFAGCDSPADDDATVDDTATTPSPTPDTTPTSDIPGKLELTFAIDTDWMDYMATYGEYPVGTFYGSIFLAEDVDGDGPADDAEDLGGIEVDVVDLVGTTPPGGPTQVLFTTDDLPAVRVCILGFLDSDGNANPDSPGPDDKDPVTLPGDNYFTVIPGETTTVTVFFGLLNP